MKKLIFGCALMIAGMIGFAGCLVAQISLVQPGAWSGFVNQFSYIELETFIILGFLVIAVIGAVISIKALKNDK